MTNVKYVSQHMSDKNCLHIFYIKRDPLEVFERTINKQAPRTDPKFR